MEPIILAISLLIVYTTLLYLRDYSNALNTDGGVRYDSVYSRVWKLYIILTLPIICLVAIPVLGFAFGFYLQDISILLLGTLGTGVVCLISIRFIERQAAEIESKRKPSERYRHNNRTRIVRVRSIVWWLTGIDLLALALITYFDAVMWFTMYYLLLWWGVFLIREQVSKALTEVSSDEQGIRKQIQGTEEEKTTESEAEKSHE